MNKTLLRFGLTAILASAVLISTGCGKNDASSSKAENITLQLHWIPDSHQIGFWTALDKGIYKENGLEVTVLSGGLDANPIKDALSGAADIGQVGGIEQVSIAVSEGLPLKAIASIHRETPHALISLASNPIRGPSDFMGKTIAVAYGDTAEVLLRSYMAKAGIPESSVKFVPFKFDLTPLLSGQVDAITGFSTGQPATIEKLGGSPVVLAYSTAGVASYGYTLVASDKTLEKRGATIDKFLKSSREGWDYAFKHPDEAIALFKKRFGDSVDEKLSRRELELIKPLMLSQDGNLLTWKLDGERVSGVMQFLNSQGQLKKDIPVQSIYNNSHTE